MGSNASALRKALTDGDNKSARRLLIAGSVDVNTATDPKTGWPLLIVAAHRGILPAVTCLCEAGAIPDLAMPSGETALHKAVEQQHVPVAQYLVLTVSANGAIADNRGITPLHIVSINGNDELAALIIRSGFSTASHPNARGDTPLHLAARNGHLDVVRLLVEEGGADMGALNSDKETALNLAEHCGKSDVVLYLSEAMAKNSVRVSGTKRGGGLTLTNPTLSGGSVYSGGAAGGAAGAGSGVSPVAGARRTLTPTATGSSSRTLTRDGSLRTENPIAAMMRAKSGSPSSAGKKK